MPREHKEDSLPQHTADLKTRDRQVAIITGGGDGLGRALARRLVPNGAVVALFDVNAERLARATTELGPNARGWTVDVTQPGQVRQAVREVIAAWQKIDILVNCAGITGATNRKSHEVELADFRRVMELNLFGSFNTFQAVIPHMLAQRYGRVLHVASIAGKEGNAGMLAYSASKAAVIGMTKVQGKEYAESGVVVNAIAPAVIRTELVDKMPPAQVEYMTSRIPMKRCGTLEEFAALAAFIVSPETSFTTGFTFDLTGGRTVY